MAKKRLDILVHEKYPQYSRRQIQSWIMQGKILVDNHPITKPGTQLKPDVEILLNAKEQKYVSRAGFKLEKALDHFGIDPAGKIVLDAGLSTGGFTDCLLQRRAEKIYGVDVGYGQVHEKIRNNPRVILMERTNLRTLSGLPEPVDMITLDLSFISLLKVMDAIAKIIKKGGDLITLIKPQFEAEKHQVGKKGIIKDSAIHQEVVEKVTVGIKQHGFDLKGVIESPITGATGNKEFLAYFVKQ